MGGGAGGVVADIEVEGERKGGVLLALRTFTEEGKKGEGDQCEKLQPGGRREEGVERFGFRKKKEKTCRRHFTDVQKKR